MSDDVDAFIASLIRAGNDEWKRLYEEKAAELDRLKADIAEALDRNSGNWTFKPTIRALLGGSE